MSDREKVISGLEDTAGYFRHLQSVGFFGDQPVFREHECHCNDAIDILKEQETTDTRKSRIFQCEKCGYGIEDIFLNSEYDYPIVPDYCPNCGRKVKQG